MRLFITGCFICVSLSCREVQPFESVQTIGGYQLDGEVTTSIGVPVEGVDVRLYFNYQYISDAPGDTQTVYVRDAPNRSMLPSTTVTLAS